MRCQLFVNGLLGVALFFGSSDIGKSQEVTLQAEEDATSATKRQDFVGISDERSFDKALADALRQMDKAVAAQQIPCNKATWRVTEIGGESGGPGSVNILEVRITATFRSRDDGEQAQATVAGTWHVTRTASDEMLEGFTLTPAGLLFSCLYTLSRK